MESSEGGFRQLAKSQVNACNNEREYVRIRALLRGYGFNRFYNEMEKKKIFQNGEISNYNNVFAQMLRDPKIKRQEYLSMKNFIMITCYRNTDHKLLTPRSLEWDSFNVLTLSKKHLPMLKNMKKIAESWAIIYHYRKPFFCFHCHPFNSVQTLHLHVVDLAKEPNFYRNRYNLSLDTVIKVIEDEK